MVFMVTRQLHIEKHIFFLTGSLGTKQLMPEASVILHLWITPEPRVPPVRCFTVWAIMALRRGTVDVNTPYHPIDEELQLLEGRYQAANFPVDLLLIVYHLCTSVR